MTLNFKIFWGSMPLDPPTLERLWRSKHFSCAYTFKISRFDLENGFNLSLDLTDIYTMLRRSRLIHFGRIRSKLQGLNRIMRSFFFFFFLFKLNCMIPGHEWRVLFAPFFIRCRYKNTAICQVWNKRCKCFCSQLKPGIHNTG